MNQCLGEKYVNPNTYSHYQLLVLLRHRNCILLDCEIKRITRNRLSEIIVTIERISKSFSDLNANGNNFIFTIRNRISKINRMRAWVITPSVIKNTEIIMIIIFLYMLTGSQKYIFSLYPLYRKPYFSLISRFESLCLLR